MSTAAGVKVQQIKPVLIIDALVIGASLVLMAIVTLIYILICDKTTY